MKRPRVTWASGITWADYVRERALVFPPEWKSWADIPKAEAKRLTRNWRRWQARRCHL